MNTFKDGGIEGNFLTLLHEKFHHWQYLFTPYGHLKWGCYRTVSSDVIDIWLNATNLTPDERRIPISYLLNKEDKSSLQGAATIYLLETSLKTINLMERNCIDSEVEQILQFEKNHTSPTITINGEKYTLNGIDIIECFAKYQEAIFGYLMERKKFEDTMNPSVLRSEYYMAYVYFIEQLGTERIFEFPVVCELALTVNKLSKFNNLEKWKMYHPAWRFLKIIRCLQDNPKIIYLDSKIF